MSVLNSKSDNCQFLQRMLSRTFMDNKGFVWMKNYKFVIFFVTLYLVVFTILGRLEVELSIMMFLFSLSPLLILWMVYSILKNGKYSGKGLENSEWGYEDKPKRFL